MTETHDLEAVKARLDLAAEVEYDLGPAAKKSGKWLMWCCPFHNDGRTPSLGVTPASGTFYCFGCGRAGDVISWLHAPELRGLSIPEIIELSGDAPEPDAPPAPPRPPAHSDEPRPAAWQERGRSFLTYAQEQIMANPEALAYLQGPQRGLTLETIKAAGLGYNPKAWSDTPQRWGLDPEEYQRVWIPRGWVIPCEIDGALWYIKVRQPDDDVQDGEDKYKHISGGRAALYAARHLKPDGRPLVVTEGEFDCLLLEQEAGDLVQVATLGSAGRKPKDRWLSLLLSFPSILLAYDADEAGQHGMNSWLETTAKARIARLPSRTANDITDAWREGNNLRAWISSYVAKSPPRPARLPAAAATAEFDRAFAEWSQKSQSWYVPGILEMMREQWPDLAAESDVLQNQLEKLWGRDLHGFKKALDKWERIFLKATSRLADKAA